jgi:hypothetical protein
MYMHKYLKYKHKYLHTRARNTGGAISTFKNKIGCLFINNLNNEKEMWDDLFIKVQSIVPNTIRYNSIHITPSTFQGDCSYESVLQEIDRYVKQLDAENVVLISHSAGVFYTLLYALHHPIKLVISIDPSNYCKYTNKVVSKEINDLTVSKEQKTILKCWQHLKKILYETDFYFPDTQIVHFYTSKLMHHMLDCKEKFLLHISPNAVLVPLPDLSNHFDILKSDEVATMILEYIANIF